MRSTQPEPTWVVYQVTAHGKTHQGAAVCEQADWDAMEAARPGFHTLVRSGIATEGEAERLARGTAGDQLGRMGRRKG